jgi:hypothetical protein
VLLLYPLDVTCSYPGVLIDIYKAISIFRMTLGICGEIGWPGCYAPYPVQYTAILSNGSSFKSTCYPRCLDLSNGSSFKSTCYPRCLDLSNGSSFKSTCYPRSLDLSPALCNFPALCHKCPNKVNRLIQLRRQIRFLGFLAGYLRLVLHCMNTGLAARAQSDVPCCICDLPMFSTFQEFG